MLNLPKKTGSEECARSTDFFTRERIASKIKQICAKYRKVLDAGRHRGGRMVAIFYDLCSEIWSLAPAAKYVQAGLETLKSSITPIDEDIVVGNLISFGLTNIVTV